MGHWTDGIPPASTPVACGDAVHTVRWEAGHLRALDHHDPDAERALVALGGESCPCIDLLGAWTAHATDPRVLVLGPRGGETRPAPIASNAPGRSGGGTVFTSVSMSGGSVGRARSRRSSVPQMLPGTIGEDRLATLLGVGGALPRRLVATVAASLIDRIEDPSIRPTLHAAVYGRLLAGAGMWLGVIPELDLELIGSTDERSLRRDGDGLVARLPFDWLLEVWARELTTVWGQLVLSASRHGGSDEWHLLSVDPALEVNSCTLSLS